MRTFCRICGSSRTATAIWHPQLEKEGGSSQEPIRASQVERKIDRHADPFRAAVVDDDDHVVIVVFVVVANLFQPSTISRQLVQGMCVPGVARGFVWRGPQGSSVRDVELVDLQKSGLGDLASRPPSAPTPLVPSCSQIDHMKSTNWTSSLWRPPPRSGCTRRRGKIVEDDTP